MQKCGFAINKNKSSRTPVSEIEFLGMVIKGDEIWASPKGKNAVQELWKYLQEDLKEKREISTERYLNFIGKLQ